MDELFRLLDMGLPEGEFAKGELMTGEARRSGGDTSSFLTARPLVETTCGLPVLAGRGDFELTRAADGRRDSSTLTPAAWRDIFGERVFLGGEGRGLEIGVGEEGEGESKLSVLALRRLVTEASRPMPCLPSSAGFS